MNGLRFHPNTTLAIEPLLVLGLSSKTYKDKDNWTVLAENFCAHEEDTIFIHENNIEIITRLNWKLNLMIILI